MYQRRAIALLLLTASLVHVNGEKTVLYTVQYTNGSCSGTDLPTLSLSGLPNLATALDVMEEAVRVGGTPQEHQFLTTFSDADGDVGYSVESIGETENRAPCYWTLYIQSGDEEIKPSLGVDDYIPGDQFEVILRYESQLFAPTITTTYILDYPDPFCFDAIPPTPITVVTRSGSTVLDVMEEGVAQGGREYNFSVSYSVVMEQHLMAEGGVGYLIHQLNGVARNGSCSWVASITSPEGIERVLTVPVSQYTIPGSGYTLIMRYVEPEIPSVTTGGAVKLVFDFTLLLISLISLGLAA